MGRRSAILLGLFFSALPGGLWLLSYRDSQPVIATLRHTLTDGVMNTSPAAIGEYLEKQTGYFIALIVNNPALLLYAGVAVAGVLMMLLIVHHAASGGWESNQKALELLKEEKERAENLARMKSEFLNQVSHELRTPLAVIIGYLECMTDGLYGQVESKHQEILQLVAKQSHHLKNMIDQILIFSRLEASKQPLRLAEVCIGEFLEDVKDTFSFLCRQKGLTLTWDVPPDLPRIRTDAERLKEIVSNLLQNALKYTDRGSVSLSIRNAAETESIAIILADTGIGVPENLLGTIFEPFVQVHKTSAENSRGGIGLGLSIVKKHLEQLGGRISVESTVGKGSTFVVSLPSSYKGAHGNRLLRMYRDFKLRHLRATPDHGGVHLSQPGSPQRSSWVH